MFKNRDLMRFREYFIGVTLGFINLIVPQLLAILVLITSLSVLAYLNYKKQNTVWVTMCLVIVGYLTSTLILNDILLNDYLHR